MCFAKLAEFRKTSVIFSIFIWLLAFGSILFFARRWHLKNGRPLSAPPGAIFISLNFQKKRLEKMTSNSFHQKNIKKFWWKLKEYKQYLHPMNGFFSSTFFRFILKFLITLHITNYIFKMLMCFKRLLPAGMSWNAQGNSILPKTFSAQQ